MSGIVAVASANESLLAQISARLLHPSIGVEEIVRQADAAELAALVETAEVDLVVLDPELPKLTKSLVKQLNRSVEIILVSVDPEAKSRFGFGLTAIKLTDLSGKLSKYRSELRIASDSSQSQLLLFAAVASGSGASSVAINAAYQLSKQSNVLLMDFDLTHSSIAAQLNLNQPATGMVKTIQVVLQGELTTAELALNCVNFLPTLRLLTGNIDLNQMVEMDFALLAEIVDTAMKLDQIVILDLGQLLSYGPIAVIQHQLLAMATKVMLVCAADPISLLNTCNWLTGTGNKYKSKLEVVINKLSSKAAAPEIAKLITEAIGSKPVAYFPEDHKLFQESLWSGKIAAALTPKSKFARTMRNWANQSEAIEIPVTNKSKRGLARLKQVS